MNLTHVERLHLQHGDVIALVRSQDRGLALFAYLRMTPQQFAAAVAAHEAQQPITFGQLGTLLALGEGEPTAAARHYIQNLAA